MKLLKSKKGFTLIELLVVIGILAVLAAIAIPSVAGLIDRANISADATNANEMTNAIERFTSEYELYLQDIASGKVDANNLDAAQGRVYNVTGVTDRAGIENLEKDATAGVDTTGKAIYRDTKYPVNAETMQAVVENYMKTSSTTFTPKQSDCHYYYSPDCGLVVCTETEASDVTDLNKLVQSGKDAKGKDLGASTKWIDLTLDTALSGGNSASLPEKGKTLEEYTWEEVRDIIAAGKATEYGFEVGQTKTLVVDTTETIFQEDLFEITMLPQQTRTATIIGLDHDGSNTATFMIVSSGGIGYNVMNTNETNNGGWETSEMRTWLNEDIYNSMSNKDYIKSVSKMTNNTGYQGITATATSDKVFLLSAKETDVAWRIADWGWYSEEYKPVLEAEGITYEWFESNIIDDDIWLRSPYSQHDGSFFSYHYYNLGEQSANKAYVAYPAFVIG